MHMRDKICPRCLLKGSIFLRTVLFPDHPSGKTPEIIRKQRGRRGQAKNCKTNSFFALGQLRGKISNSFLVDARRMSVSLSFVQRHTLHPFLVLMLASWGAWHPEYFCDRKNIHLLCFCLPSVSLSGPPHSAALVSTGPARRGSEVPWKIFRGQKEIGHTLVSYKWISIDLVFYAWHVILIVKNIYQQQLLACWRTGTFWSKHWGQIQLGLKKKPFDLKGSKGSLQYW